MRNERYTPEELSKMSKKELEELTSDIRALLIETVSKNGGHLASNLGIVELTIALHSVFHTPQDKIIFDVGHQAYVHKLLTGRKDRFHTLRTLGGISGFPRYHESEHDAFSTGHASTSLSAGLGMARARKLMGENGAVVVVLGDGALTGGMCYEALNDAGQSKTPIIVILNDNEMSISRNVGALAAYLTRLRQSAPYQGVKRGMRRSLEHIPLVGKPLMHMISKMHEMLKTLMINEKFFDALGFHYLGPIDGHDIKKMVRALKHVQNTDRPVLLHVVTQKGRGYVHAENRPDDFHGVAPFFVDSGELVKKSNPSNSEVMVDELCTMAAQDSRITAITAAMPIGTGLSGFAGRFSERFFDVGIAEEHAVTMAAGMATLGLRPYVAIYSTFLQRSYDQIMMDACLSSLPVTFMIDRGGLVGEDGSTHQGVFDLSYLRQIPNLIVSSPRDIHDLRRLMRLSIDQNQPMAIRYAKDAVDMGDGLKSCNPLHVGVWELLASGSDVVILAVGRMVQIALQVSIELHGKNVECGVIDARFIKPMDEALLRDTAEKYPLIVTLEDNVIAGGFGSAVMEQLSSWGMNKRVMNLGVPDKFIEHGKVAEQMVKLGFTPDAISTKILEAIK